MRKTILIILLAFSMHTISQNIEYQINSYTYNIEKSKYTVTNLNVVNSSDHKIILWLDNNTKNCNQTVEVKLHDYFFKRKGDFSLSNIISEYGSTIENVSTDIYYTFYKIIEPKKTFCITILCKHNNSKAHIKVIDELKKQIIVMSENDVKKIEMKFYNFNDLKIMSFKGEQIILSSTDLSFSKCTLKKK